MDPSLIEVRRFRFIMLIGGTLVLIWGYLFSKLSELQIPFYILISLDCYLGSLLTFFDRFKKNVQMLYTIVSAVAIFHHYYLIHLNQYHPYLLTSSMLAILLAIIPLSNWKNILFLTLSSIIFVSFELALFPQKETLVFFLGITSSAIVISYISFEKNLLLKKIQEDYKLLQEEKLKSTSAAKMAALGEMSSGIAHEINNPLAVIIGNQNLIKKALEKNPEILKEVSSRIDSTDKMAHRISKIIRALKSFTRENSGGYDEVVKMDEVLDDTLSFCQTRFLSRGVNLVFDISEWNFQIKGNAVQLSQVILNLLNNAFDALEFQEIKTIKMVVLKDENSVRILVQDSGSGVPKEIKDKIMQPFFTTKEVGKGTGLGLSISKGIVDAHKGEFFLDESYLETTFVIKLPLII